MILNTSSPLKSSVVKEFFSARKSPNKASHITLKQTLDKQNYQIASLGKRQSSMKTLIESNYANNYSKDVIPEDCVQELSNFRKKLENTLTSQAIQDKKQQFKEFALKIKKQFTCGDQAFKKNTNQTLDNSKFQEIINKRTSLNFSPNTHQKNNSFIPTKKSQENNAPNQNQISTLNQKINNFSNHKHTYSSFLPVRTEETNRDSISKFNFQKLLDTQQRDSILKNSVSKENSNFYQYSQTSRKDSFKNSAILVKQKPQSNIFSTGSSINFRNNIEEIKNQIKQLETKRYEDFEKIETASQSQANSLFQNVNKQQYTLVTCRKRKFSQDISGNQILPQIKEIIKFNEAFKSNQETVSSNYIFEVERLFETLQKFLHHAKQQ